MDKKNISDAVEMTKGVPWSDVLTQLTQEEKEICPYPQVEYTIVEAPTMDKLVRDVNTHLANGRVCDGGVQISSGPIARFYQSMERRNVDADFGPEPEMPRKNSEGDTQGPIAPLWEGMEFLENEPDLYEDIDEDETTLQGE